MDEFVQIRGFPDYYINKAGVVISFRRGTERQMKLSKDKDGYLFVILYDLTGKPHTKKIHRLLAEAFIHNDADYPIVRHLDDNKTNNDLENLRWGTLKDNSADSRRNGSFYTRPVYCYENETEYKSIKEASIDLGVCTSDIIGCAKGKISHSKGYHFSYVNEVDHGKELYFSQRPHRSGRILATNIYTGKQIEFGSQKEASEALNIFASNISMCLSGTIKRCKEWVFEYIKEET